MGISIVVAEDFLLLRQGVERLLESDPDLQVVASVDTLPRLLAAVAQHRPDLVITDVRMPPTGTDEGIRAARQLRDSHPGTGVLVLSQYAEAEWALSLLQDGSSGRGYLLKERVTDPEQFLSAVHAVASGDSAVDPVVVESLVRTRSRPADSPLRRLSPRELEVLALIAEGKNNAGVADALVLTVRAVEKHINSVFAKLGLSEETDVHRRVMAVLLYLSDRDV